MISLDQLKEILDYDPVSGDFRWKKKPSSLSRCHVGEVAGTKRGSSAVYVQIKLYGRVYLGHRLAWFYMTGEWPSIIDHKNCDPYDNSWENLRLATTAQNAWNAGVYSTNKLGIKGVFKLKRRNLYSAQIRNNGRLIGLGLFKTAEDAKQAYADAANRLRGEFART